MQERDEKGRFVKGSVSPNKGKPIEEWMSEEVIEKIKKYRFKKGDPRLIGNTWGFKKGYVPFSKGKKMWGEDGFTGKDNPFKGKHHTEETRKQMRENHWTKTGVIEHPFKGKHHSKKTREKISKTLKERYAKKEIIPFKGKKHITEETKERWREIRPKIAKKLWQDPKYVEKVIKALHKKPNKEELQLDQLIQQTRPGEFAYNGDFSQGITIGGRIPDWVNINGKKEVIEYFGDYWHSPLRNPRVPWNKTYEATIRHYRKYGYRCLVIWYHELENPEGVIAKIRKYP